MSKRLTDLLALSHVPRWSIVDHTRHQSVADHTFRVLAIALELGDLLGIPPGTGLLRAILFHDAPESRTADIPNPAKQAMVGATDTDHYFCPWMSLERLELSESHTRILHLADKIEGYTFITRYGDGPHARAVAKRCRQDLMDEVAKLESYGTDYRDAVGRVCAEILNDSGRANW